MTSERIKTGTDLVSVVVFYNTREWGLERSDWLIVKPDNNNTVLDVKYANWVSTTYDNINSVKST